MDVDKVKEIPKKTMHKMLLLSWITFFDNFPSWHCPHAVFTALGNNKSERKEGKRGKLILVSFSPLNLHPHNIQQCT